MDSSLRHLGRTSHRAVPPAGRAGRREAPRSTGWRLFDGASTLAFVLVWSGFFVRFTGHASALEAALLIALFALPAFVAADLGAGLLHWFADTFFAPSTPLIGRTLIQAFRDHHGDPGAMARRGVIEVSGLNCFAGVVLLGFGAALDAATLAGRATLIALLWFTLALALTNLFHRWAHATRVPRIAVWLQRRGWILSPEAHGLHHSGAHDRAFCVTTGWLNPPLDRLGFFRGLERGVRRLTRARSRSKLAKGTRAN